MLQDELDLQANYAMMLARGPGIPHCARSSWNAHAAYYERLQTPLSPFHETGGNVRRLREPSRCGRRESPRAIVQARNHFPLARRGTSASGVTGRMCRAYRGALFSLQLRSASALR